MADGLVACSGCEETFKSRSGLAAHRRAKHPAAPASVSVAETVRGELGDLVSSPLGAAAVLLARAMDETESARDLPPLAKELRAVLAEVDAGEESEGDVVDDLAARRAARRADASGASRSAGGQ